MFTWRCRCEKLNQGKVILYNLLHGHIEKQIVMETQIIQSQKDPW